ncbi:hypothetical protein D3C76_1050270 [compost metagenome]
MRLVHDHALHRPQAVIHLGAGVVVRPTGIDQVDGLAGGRARTHPLEEMPRLAILEINVREKPVLEQPTPYQALPCARCIEQVFPLHHLQRFFRARHQGLFIDRRTGSQPALQRLVLLISQAGDRQGHAFLGVSAGISVELARQGAHVLAIETQDDVRRQFGIGLQRIAVPQFQHARHQCGLASLGVEHRIEAFLLPGALAERVKEQPARRDRLAAIAVIHRDFRRATGRALPAAQVELTGGVVAGVAGHALFSEDRLDVATVGNAGG